MDRWWQAAGVLGVALLFGWEVTNAVEVSVPDADEAQTFDFDIPALPLRSAAEAFARRIGRHTYVGHEAFAACSDFVLDPLVGRFTAHEGWRRLTAPICAASGVVVERPGDAPVYMVDHPWVAEREIRIPRASLIDALGVLSQQFGALPLEYQAVDAAEGQRLVGPISGHMSPDEALQRMEAQIGSGLRHRRDGPVLLLESGAEQTQPYAWRYFFGRHCACPVRTEQLLTQTVTVTEPAIPDPDRGGVVSYSRKQIEATGASTLPQFFRYLAQNGYSRPEGHIASGAQYADFRGLGRDTHLVTINGVRTLPSANNITSSAFDLNTIPLPAVERVDIRVDSASMRLGSDAIAGTIDIIMRRELAGEARLRYGRAHGGAEERRTTFSVGGRSPAGRVSALFDYFETGQLLGAERALSRDQDYSREGGTDYRSLFGFRSLDGTNLPGLAAPIAGIPDTRQSEVLSIDELLPGAPRAVSLWSYQSIVPASTRGSIVASADTRWRDVTFATDLLWVKRESAYQYYPAVVSGVVSETHPFNPFHQRVWIDALLTGAPPMQQHVESELRRGVLSARGGGGRWTWDVAALNSNEDASAWVDHTLDPTRTAEALSPLPGQPAWDVFAARPGGTDAPLAVWAEPVVQRFSSSGTHLLGSLAARLGETRLQLGVERREEAMQFNATVGRVARNVWGGYAHLTLPLVDPDRQRLGLRGLTASAGVRRDSFSDVPALTRTHAEIEWKLTDRFSVAGNLAQQYRPPSLFELNLPQLAVPVQLYDPRRQESASALLIAGGNRALRPTTGRSTHIRATYQSVDGLTASLNYFAIRLWDRIAALPMSAVLAAEDEMPDRVVREPTPEDLAAGRPGRLISVDVTRDNVGRLFTRGIDASVYQSFDGPFGSFTPRMDLTWIDTFRHSSAPGTRAHMIDRVGIASEQGTITRWRAVVSMGWQARSWAATTFLRLIPAYDDIDGGHIGSQQLVDLNVSYVPSPRVTITLGAMDLANTSPHFAQVGAATGYDSSQWDPVGRRVMLTAKVSL